jgi:TP901 family phage tail tape measure protein
VADQSYGIQVGIDATPAQAGAATFQRSAEQVAQSAEKLNTGVKATGESMKGLGDGLNEIAQKFTGFNVASLAAAGAVGALVAVFTEAVVGAAETEEAFVRLQNVTNQTDEAFEGTKATLEKLSDQFGNSRAEEAGAAAKIAARGFDDAATSAKILAEANKLALASGQDLGTSTELLAKSLQLFKADASEAAHYAADLNTILVQAQIPPQQLQQEFVRLGPEMVKAGVSMDQFTKGVIDLKAAGVEGRLGLQAMRSIVTAIAGDTPKAAEAFSGFTDRLQEAGYKAQTFKQLVGEAGGITEALKVLQDVTHGNTIEFSELVGGTAALSGATALTGLTSEQAAKSMNQLSGAAKSYNDNAARAAETTQNLAKITKNEFSNVLDDLGTVVLPLVNLWLQSIKGVLEGLKYDFEVVSKAMGGVKDAIAGFATKLIPDSWTQEVGNITTKLKDLVGLKAAAASGDTTSVSDDLQSIKPTATKIKEDASTLDPSTQQAAAKVKDEQNTAAKAQADLNTLRGASSAQLKALGIDLKQAAELEGDLAAKVLSARDAADKFNVAWKAVAAANDPVAKALNDNSNAVRKIGEDALKAGVGGEALTKVLTAQQVAFEKNVIAANAKVVNLGAATDAEAKFESEVAKESERLVEANAQYALHNISLQQLNLIYVDVADKIKKVQEGLSGESKETQNLTKATNDYKSALDQIAAGTGTEAEKATAAKEAAINFIDAKDKADQYGNELLTLVGKYVPLVTQAKAYREEQEKIALLQGRGTVTSAQAGTASALAANQFQQSAVKDSAAPSSDKAGAQAALEYQAAQIKLNAALAEGSIDQDQFNRATLEIKENFAQASAAYSQFAQAVQSAGKTMGDALEKYLINPSKGLKSLLLDITKGLQQEAAKLVVQNAEKNVYGALAGSSNSTISGLGTNLAAGAGVKLGSQAGGGAQLLQAGTSLTGAAASLKAAAAALQQSAAGGGAGGLGSDLSGLGDADSANASAASDALGAAEDAFGFAGGGNVKKGSTHLVGENGPELVTFGDNGRVSNNADTRAAIGTAAGNKAATIVQPPNVNVPVQVVNVQDPNHVPAAMSGPAGTKAILNVLSQNRTAVNSLLG